MTAVLLAAAAGAAFGGLAVAVRWGLARGPDAEVGAFVAVAVAALGCVAAASPFVATRGIDVSQVWPFFVAGLLAPGASQIALTFAVRHAGPSRAAIVMGTAPLASILIALTLLGEPFRPLLVVATALIVLGGTALAVERTRPNHFRLRGIVFAIVCALLFAVRDNLVRWAARSDRPAPLVGATASLLGATLFIALYLVLVRRSRIGADLGPALSAFAPAAAALALGYGSLLAAFDHGRVSVVSPLNATGSLWALLLAAVALGRSERIRRSTVVAALLVVAGGALIGVLR